MPRHNRTHQIFFLTFVFLDLRVSPVDFLRELTHFYNSVSLTLLRPEIEIAEDKKQGSVFLTRMISTRSQEDIESSVVNKLLPCQRVMCVYV